MKCPNCGGHLGIEDIYCPYCGSANTLALRHQADMERYQSEYLKTQESVMEKTRLLRRHGSWLVILAVILSVMVAAVVLQASAWRIGYSIREKNVTRLSEVHRQALEDYLAAGDYGKFLGYYDANDLNLDNDNDYYAVRTAAYGYTDLIQYISALNDPAHYSFQEAHLASTCQYIAEDLERVFGVERDYRSFGQEYLTPEKLVYIRDMQERSGFIARAYFGLSEEEVEQIPELSATALAALVERGVRP